MLPSGREISSALITSPVHSHGWVGKKIVILIPLSKSLHHLIPYQLSVLSPLATEHHHYVLHSSPICSSNIAPYSLSFSHMHPCYSKYILGDSMENIWVTLLASVSLVYLKQLILRDTSNVSDRFVA